MTTERLGAPTESPCSGSDSLASILLPLVDLNHKAGFLNALGF